ncbi:unnamed protein product [Closterium sp. NIES-54]
MGVDRMRAGVGVTRAQQGGTDSAINNVAEGDGGRDRMRARGGWAAGGAERDEAVQWVVREALVWMPHEHCTALLALLQGGMEGRAHEQAGGGGEDGEQGGRGGMRWTQEEVRSRVLPAMHGLAWIGRAGHGMAWHGMAWHVIACNCSVVCGHESYSSPEQRINVVTRVVLRHFRRSAALPEGAGGRGSAGLAARQGAGATGRGRAGGHGRRHGADELAPRGNVLAAGFRRAAPFMSPHSELQWATAPPCLPGLQVNHISTHSLSPIANNTLSHPSSSSNPPKPTPNALTTLPAVASPLSAPLPLNTAWAVVTSPPWQHLLNKVGVPAMAHLLSHASIFVPLGASSFVQVAGPPVSSHALQSRCSTLVRLLPPASFHFSSCSPVLATAHSQASACMVARTHHAVARKAAGSGEGPCCGVALGVVPLQGRGRRGAAQRKDGGRGVGVWSAEQGQADMAMDREVARSVGGDTVERCGEEERVQVGQRTGEDGSVGGRGDGEGGGEECRGGELLLVQAVRVRWQPRMMGLSHWCLLLLKLYQHAALQVKRLAMLLCPPVTPLHLRMPCCQQHWTWMAAHPPCVLAAAMPAVDAAAPLDSAFTSPSRKHAPLGTLGSGSRRRAGCGNAKGQGVLREVPVEVLVQATSRQQQVANFVWAVLQSIVPRPLLPHGRDERAAALKGGTGGRAEAGKGGELKGGRKMEASVSGAIAGSRRGGQGVRGQGVRGQGVRGQVAAKAAGEHGKGGRRQGMRRMRQLIGRFVVLRRFDQFPLHAAMHRLPTTCLPWSPAAMAQGVERGSEREGEQREAQGRSGRSKEGREEGNGRKDGSSGVGEEGEQGMVNEEGRERDEEGGQHERAKKAGQQEQRKQVQTMGEGKQERGGGGGLAAQAHQVLSCVWVQWVLAELVIPVLRSHFYITESEAQRHTVCFYRKPVYLALECLSSSTFHKLTPAAVRRLLLPPRRTTAPSHHVAAPSQGSSFKGREAGGEEGEGRALGIAKVQFVPKAQSVRPIVSLAACTHVSLATRGRQRKRARAAGRDGKGPGAWEEETGGEEVGGMQMSAELGAQFRSAFGMFAPSGGGGGEKAVGVVWGRGLGKLGIGRAM